jgi:hypothetical protein
MFSKYLHYLGHNFNLLMYLKHFLHKIFHEIMLKSRQFDKIQDNQTLSSILGFKCLCVSASIFTIFLSNEFMSPFLRKLSLFAFLY